MTDKVSDLVARIKNGQKRGRLVVEVMRNRLCVSVLECLLREGYIRSYVVKERVIEVHLKYKYGQPLLEDIKRISRPGFRCYFSAKKLREEYLKSEIIVYTSSRGVKLNSNLVVGKGKDGGEPLFSIR